MKKHWVGFACGAGTSLSLYGLFQDFMGLEGYTAYLQLGWVSAVYSVPITVVCLVIFAFTMRYLSTHD